MQTNGSEPEVAVKPDADLDVDRLPDMAVLRRRFAPDLAIPLEVMATLAPFVPVKTEEQDVAASVFHTRGLIIKQRTQLSNAIRGHLAKYGGVVQNGAVRLAMLADRLEGGKTGGTLPAVADDGRDASLTPQAGSGTGRGDRTACTRGQGGAPNDNDLGHWSDHRHS